MVLIIAFALRVLRRLIQSIKKSLEYLDCLIKYVEVRLWVWKIKFNVTVFYWFIDLALFYSTFLFMIFIITYFISCGLMLGLDNIAEYSSSTDHICVPEVESKTEKLNSTDEDQQSCIEQPISQTQTITASFLFCVCLTLYWLLRGSGC